MHCRCYPSMPCSRSGGWYPRFPGPHRGGKFRRIWQGGSPGPHPRGKFRRIWPGGVSRPTPKGKLRGNLARGGLQAHTWGVCSWRGLFPGGSAPGGGLCGAPSRWLLLRAVRIPLECILAKLCPRHAEANAKVKLLQTDHSKRIPSYGRPSEIYFSWNSGGMSIFKRKLLSFCIQFCLV